MGDLGLDLDHPFVNGDGLVEGHGDAFVRHLTDIADRPGHFANLAPLSAGATPAAESA